MTQAPVIFEHQELGTLLVLDMIDVDDERTDDVELAMQVLCSSPDGDLMVAPTSEGILMRVKALQ